MASTTLRVADMHCSACVLRLEGLEDDLPGVLKAEASYRAQRLVVRYDETVVNREQIIAAIAELGYEAVPI